MSIILEPNQPGRIKVSRMRGTGNEMWFLPLKREKDPNPKTSDKKGLATYGEQWDILIDRLAALDGETIYPLAQQDVTPWSQCRVSVEDVGSLPLRYRPGQTRDTTRDILLYGIWFDLDTGFEILEGATATLEAWASPAIPTVRDSEILDLVFRTYGGTLPSDPADPSPEIVLDIPKYTSRRGFYLVVDLGNTRTTCLAVVDPAGDIVNVDLRRYIIRVGFAASDTLRGLDPQRSVEEIVDSGFALRDPITSDWVQLTSDSYGRLTGRRYQPPGALMGPDVRTAREVYRDNRIFLSSPKRYIWDDEKRAKWEIGRRPWADARATVSGGKTEPLSAHESVCPDLADPAFVPRKYATVWLAMHILDAAVEAVTEHFLSGELVNCMPTLKGLRVTFPTGWGEKERTTYRDLWDRACQEWMVRHGLTGEQPSSVLVDLDEATASQLPLLHDLIQALGSNAAGFLALVGSRDENVCRIMSVDLGGGSTDAAVVSYSLAPNQNRLVSERGVRFSSPIAGDSILKETLAKVVLPAMWGTDKELGHALRALFSDGREVSSVHRACLLTELFVPLVTEWFTKREKTGKFGEVAGRLGRSQFLNELISKDLKLNNTSQRDRVTNFDLGSISTDQFRGVVRRELQSIAKSVSDVAYQEKVDLMVVTGKTSELPEVQEYLRELSLLPTSRIVFVHGLPIGLWYPFRGEDPEGGPTVVHDAKEMTVVGAVIYTLIEHSALAAWQKLDLREDEGSFVWMAIDRQMHIPDERHNVVSSSGQSFVNLMPGQMIGRKWKDYDVPALPLYRVHVPDPMSASSGLDVRVNIEGQELSAKAWRNRGGGEILAELKFQTIIEDTCWRDNGVLF